MKSVSDSPSSLPTAAEKVHQLVLRFARSHFFRNVFVVMTGTVLAQAINLAFVPVLSRLYDPDTYGAFGVFLSIVNIAGCAAAFRYDLALMLPKEDIDAAGILWLCGIVVVGVSVAIGGIFLIFGDALGTLLKTPEIIPWLWLLPFSVFFAGTWQSLTAWSTRRKQFHRASISQVTRALTGPGYQSIAGLYSPSVFSLIVGAIVGNGCAAAMFATQVFKNDWQVIRGSFQVDRIRRLAREYADFPMFSTPQLLLNSLSMNVPSLLLASYFGPAVVGYYAFGVRIVQLPMTLVVDSLRSVLFQKFSEVYNAGGDTYALFKKTTLVLAGIAVAPTIFIVLFAPTVVSFVLGERWITAGEYSRWLVLWISFGFFNVPAVLFGQIYRQQRVLVFSDATTFVCRVLAIVLGGLFFTALQTIIIFSMVGIVFNIVVIVWMWLYLRKRSSISP